MVDARVRRRGDEDHAMGSGDARTGRRSYEQEQDRIRSLSQVGRGVNVRQHFDPRREFRLKDDLSGPATNWTGFSSLNFRVGVNYQDATLNPVGQPQDFSVILQDKEGHTASLAVGDYSTALYYPPGDDLSLSWTYTSKQGDVYTLVLQDPVPRLFLNTVRMPLDAFLRAAPGLDLTNVVSIRFAFDRTPTGDLVFSNINLDTSAGPLALVADHSDAHKRALCMSSAYDNVIQVVSAAVSQSNVSIHGMDLGINGATDLDMLTVVPHDTSQKAVYTDLQLADADGALDLIWWPATVTKKGKLTDNLDWVGTNDVQLSLAHLQLQAILDQLHGRLF